MWEGCCGGPAASYQHLRAPCVCSLGLCFCRAHPARYKFKASFHSQGLLSLPKGLSQELTGPPRGKTQPGQSWGWGGCLRLLGGWTEARYCGRSRVYLGSISCPSPTGISAAQLATGAGSVTWTQPVQEMTLLLSPHVTSGRPHLSLGLGELLPQESKRSTPKMRFGK